MKSVVLFCAAVFLSLGTPVIAKTVLVTGANRGIGLEFVRQYAENGWTVIATSRTPEDDDTLKAMAADNPRIVIETLDVTNLDHIAALAQKYDGTAIDILINNAGTLGRTWSNGQMEPWNQEAVVQLMAVNAFGPMKITEAFAANVAMSDEKTVVAISSYGGSIQSNRPDRPRGYYGVSKTALNMAMRGIAMRLKDDGVKVAIVHPGGVSTRMTRESYGRMSPEEAEAAVDFQFPGFTPMTPEQSVSHMRRTIASLTWEQSGEFLRWDGKGLPW